jgi:hypothetical protein
MWYHPELSSDHGIPQGSFKSPKKPVCSVDTKYRRDRLSCIMFVPASGIVPFLYILLFHLEDNFQF